MRPPARDDRRARGVLVLLMVVMRALLRQAAELRTDMDAVI